LDSGSDFDENAAMIVLLVLITMSGELPVEMLCYGLLDE
jgi:hypothetical protein